MWCVSVYLPGSQSAFPKNNWTIANKHSALLRGFIHIRRNFVDESENLVNEY
jgi:hypothetical protein